MIVHLHVHVYVHFMTLRRVTFDVNQLSIYKLVIYCLRVHFAQPV